MYQFQTKTGNQFTTNYRDLYNEKLQIFELKNNKWVKTENYNPAKKDIILYDIVNGIMQPIGIGQF